MIKNMIIIHNVIYSINGLKRVRIMKMEMTSISFFLIFPFKSKKYYFNCFKWISAFWLSTSVPVLPIPSAKFNISGTKSLFGLPLPSSRSATH